MKRIGVVVLALLSLAPVPGRAQTDGADLMRRGLELFLDGLQDGMAPALRDLEGMVGEIGPALRDFMAEMGPAFGQLLAEVKDWSAYEPPEMLPNGDIIIRRKPDVPDPEKEPGTTPGEVPPAEGQIDL